MRASCPACHRPVVSIELQIDERPLTMQSCTSCDRRWWLSGGLPVESASLFRRRHHPEAA